MSRFTGPRVKIARRLGQYLPGLSRKQAKHRTNPPGQHGGARRRNPSEYKMRLEEKQKLRFNYGLTERQLRNVFIKARKTKGDTGHLLLQLLESRLDSVIFRSGLAPTIPAARQMVNHGHVRVNEKKVDIASFTMKPGEKVSLKPKMQKHSMVREEFEHPTFVLPNFLSADKEKLEIVFERAPARDEVLLEVQENLIIEFYNRVT